MGSSSQRELPSPSPQPRPRFRPRVIAVEGLVRRDFRIAEEHERPIQPPLDDGAVERPVHVQPARDAVVRTHRRCGCRPAERVPVHGDAADVEAAGCTGDDVTDGIVGAELVEEDRDVGGTGREGEGGLCSAADVGGVGGGAGRVFDDEGVVGVVDG